MSGKALPRARLEAIPFARFTVECQSQLEKQSKASRVRQSVTSLFGLTEDEGGEAEEEEDAPTEAKEEWTWRGKLSPANAPRPRRSANRSLATRPRGTKKARARPTVWKRKNTIRF